MEYLSEALEQNLAHFPLWMEESAVKHVWTMLDAVDPFSQVIVGQLHPTWVTESQASAR